MSRAPWSYEVPPFAGGRRGLEGFAVQAVDGGDVGKVAVVLDRGGAVYLAVERSIGIGRHDLRAVGWEHVRAIDPNGEVVELDLTEARLEDETELDPEKGIEGGEGADARRRVALPPEFPRTSEPEATVRRARPVTSLVGGLLVLGVFTFFGAYLVLEPAWPWGIAALAVPAALIAAAVVAGLRAVREPDVTEVAAGSEDLLERPSPPEPERSADPGTR
jgi:hypothetical protein